MKSESEVTAEIVKLRQKIDRCQEMLDNPSIHSEIVPGTRRMFYSQVKRDAMLQLEQLLWLFGRSKDSSNAEF